MIKEKKQWKDNRDLDPVVFNVQKILRNAANVIADNGNHRTMLSVLSDSMQMINSLLQNIEHGGKSN